MLASVVAVVVLLREILLPFVAGMVLAYLLDPLATRLERLGMNRLVAKLEIVASFDDGGHFARSIPCVANSASVNRSTPNATQPVCATSPASVRRPQVVPK